MPEDTWASGDCYEPYIGRWSRLVATEFLRWLTPEPGRRWLDVGCGTGALTAAVLSVADPFSIVSVDQSAEFVAYAERAVHDPRVTFEVADATTLPLLDGNVDYAVSGLVLNFVPEPGRAVREMCRVLATGGMAAAYLWDYAEGMQLLRIFWDAAVALDPRAGELDEARRFPLARPEAMAGLFSDAGFAEVETTALVVPTTFRDFDDYWQPFLGAQGPAPGYVAGLDEERRTALRERLRASMPTADDGTIPLNARAWAVRGRLIRR